MYARTQPAFPFVVVVFFFIPRKFTAASSLGPWLGLGPGYAIATSAHSAPMIAP